MRMHTWVGSVAAAVSLLGSISPSAAGSPAIAVQGALGDPQLGDAKAGKANFGTYCAVCHGNEGKGNGPGAAGLKPKPRNFNDSARMAKIDNATLIKAVTEGGASVGLSPTMAAYKEALSPQQIRDLVAYVRQFAK